MRMPILTIAAMSTLALAACDQPTDGPSAPDAADDAVDAVAIDKEAPPPAPVVQAPRPARAAAPVPATTPDAAEDEAAAPADAPTAGVMDGPTPQVRDTAKEKAESTNLRPG